MFLVLVRQVNFRIAQDLYPEFVVYRFFFFCSQFPIPYCPEFHFTEFASAVADMKNSVQVSTVDCSDITD